jgi:hypothetical protein
MIKAPKKALKAQGFDPGFEILFYHFLAVKG